MGRETSEGQPPEDAHILTHPIRYRIVKLLAEKPRCEKKPGSNFFRIKKAKREKGTVIKTIWGGFLSVAIIQILYANIFWNRRIYINKPFIVFGSKVWT